MAAVAIPSTRMFPTILAANSNTRAAADNMEEWAPVGMAIPNTAAELVARTAMVRQQAELRMPDKVPLDFPDLVAALELPALTSAQLAKWEELAPANTPSWEVVVPVDLANHPTSRVVAVLPIKMLPAALEEAPLSTKLALEEEMLGDSVALSVPIRRLMPANLAVAEVSPVAA